MADPPTPPPLYYIGPQPASNPPSPMAFTDKAVYRLAAFRVTQLYPGPVGELVARELLTVDEFGWIVDATSLIVKVKDQVLDEWRKREIAAGR